MKGFSDLKRAIYFNGICVLFLGMTFLMTLAVLVLLITDRIGAARGLPTMTQEANPQISTTVHVPDELAELERVAEERGYYTRGEFAEKHGVTERVVDMWREAGMESRKSESGRVQIPTSARRPD